MDIKRCSDYIPLKLKNKHTNNASKLSITSIYVRFTDIHTKQRVMKAKHIHKKKLFISKYMTSVVNNNKNSSSNSFGTKTKKGNQEQLNSFGIE